MTLTFALPVAVETTDLTNSIVAAIPGVWKRHNTRRFYKGLLECDDHMLRDIGLSRGEVQKALAATRS